MFAVSFDLVVAETNAAHPKGAPYACIEIASKLSNYGFRRIHS